MNCPDLDALSRTTRDAARWRAFIHNAQDERIK